VRTKYDRMFERKNQNILSEHYTKLVDHDDDLLGPGEEEDEFITLKRADHDLEGPAAEPLSSEPVSKRKLKEVMSKKAMLKYKGVGKKLVFDDEGNPHELYELVDDKDFRAGNPLEEGKRFAESERAKLSQADVMDKEEAKDKKREKKRKRKEREKMNGEEVGATLAAPSDDDGYESPDIVLPDLPSDDEQEPEFVPERPAKRPRKEQKVKDDLAEEEELALRMLRGH
ncbi:hypothetical protein M422DRAFT_171714, partial [Sphaerobolus stellatus SS14]